MLRYFLVGGICLALCSCVSNNGTSVSNQKKLSKVKPGSKVASYVQEEPVEVSDNNEYRVSNENYETDTASDLQASPGIVENLQVSNSKDELYAFLTKQLSSTSIEPITEQEAQLITGISKDSYNTHGSIEEAVFALYVLNSVITNVNFSEKTLYQTCIGYDFSIIKAITLNPLLKTYKVYNMVLMASQKSDNNEEASFIAKLSAIVNKQIDLWTTLKQYDDGGALVSEDEGSGKEIKYDTSSDEGILKTAQSYADAYQYKEAVSLLEKIDSSSEYYKAAQQKIQDYSYLAVQDLRRKAATVFQNSISVSDPKVKAMYLEEAKKYLQIALKDYPHISEDQSSTVKENLMIIEENLDKSEE